MTPLERLLFMVAELNRVTSAGPVDEVTRDLQFSQDLAYSAYVIANLFRKEVWLGPGPARDITNTEIPVGMIDKELKELELSFGQRGLSTLITDHPLFRIQPDAMEIPGTSVPQLEPSLITLHLALDDPEIHLRCPLRDRSQLSQIAPDPIQKSDLEPEQIGVDANPVASILPM